MSKLNINFNAVAGMVVGLVLIIIPEPATTITGVGVVGYSAHKAGWLGKV